MARIAEELVEEWLNRQGYFTIRGLKLGVAEMDLLALKLSGSHPICRHLEVQASQNPISYVCPLTKELQRQSGRGPASAKKRTADEIRACVCEWTTKKFRHPRKLKARKRLCDSEWTEELVVNVTKYPEEIEIIRSQGIKVLKLNRIIGDLLQPKQDEFCAAGTDLVNLLVRPAVEITQDGFDL